MTSDDLPNFLPALVIYVFENKALFIEFVFEQSGMGLVQWLHMIYWHMKQKSRYQMGFGHDVSVLIIVFIKKLWFVF